MSCKCRPVRVLMGVDVARGSPRFWSVILVGLALNGNCGWRRSLAPVGSRPAEPETTSTNHDEPEANSVFNRPMQRFVVEFAVHRISAPKGTFTRDDGVWRLVTGSLPRAAMTLRMAANGIRAAVGKESDRPALVTELAKVAEPRIAPDHVSPDSSRFLELELGPCPPRQSIFYYDDAGEVHGFDFVNAKARLKMTYEMRLTNLKEVWLELAPEIEEPPGPRVWVKLPDGSLVEKEEEHKTTFADLAFSAKVPEGGFLLLGPTVAVHDQPLLARTLFIEELQSTGSGAPDIRESIYVISPLIRSYTARAPASKTPTGG